MGVGEGSAFDIGQFVDVGRRIHDFLSNVMGKEGCPMSRADPQ
jgi:hypothetical protein